jgi:hypothetical protein
MNQPAVIDQSNIELPSCPISCAHCDIIYVNEYLTQKIVCRCSCHKEKK